MSLGLLRLCWHGRLCPNISTTPLRQWGFRQCLPFSWTTLRGKHGWHPIAVMGVVDTFGLCVPKPYSLLTCDLLNVPFSLPSLAQTYLQLALRQWGASHVYLLVLSS